MLFDAHFHIIHPDYPLQENQGYCPPPFLVGDYTRAVSGLDVRGGAVVSGSFQGFDQSYLLAALVQLGEGFVGVTQIPAESSDEEIIQLDRAGVRAVRFNLKRGGSAPLSELVYLSQRVFDLVGWHSELYVDSGVLPDLVDTLKSLPAISIDHLGLTETGLPSLLSLVESGAKVKATGFGRVDMDIRKVLVELFKANPAALMFGTDLPGTRAKRPFMVSDLDLIADVFSNQAVQQILYGNAAQFYRLKNQ